MVCTNTLTDLTIDAHDAFDELQDPSPAQVRAKSMLETTSIWWADSCRFPGNDSVDMLPEGCQSAMNNLAEAVMEIDPALATWVP